MDQRAAPRTPRRSRAQLLIHPSGRHPHPLDVTIVDYSATGIGIQHSEGLLVGQRFIVREPYVTRDNTCLFTVVRSDPRPDGSYSIGLQAHNKLVDDLELLSSSPPRGPSRRAKLLYVAFTLVGIATIVVLTWLDRTG